MLKNYILTTLRNIRKHPGHFAINVTGLSLGMAVFIFIVQFVGFESRYDNFHEGPIYRIATKRYAHNELINENAASMPPLAPLISENIAEIDEITRIYNDGNCVVSSDETGELRVFDEDKAYYADGNFFKVFNFKLINGTPESALNGTRKMAISESTAKKYFGSAGSAFGKTLKVTGQVEVEYEVSGVFEDAPLNSHMKPDIIFSFITYLDVVHPDWPVRVNWVWNDFPTYMKTDGNPVELEEKINSLAQKTWEKQYKAADVNYEFFLQPIEDIHTRSNLFNEFEQNTDKAILNLLIWISIITLVVAWINYVNLATARALERAREVGVRKAIGAHRHNLLRQFFTEATITNAISITLSIALLFALKDGLQRWIGISFPLVADRVFIAAILILVAGGILAALYPAYMMSGFSITEVLKGKIQSRPGRISIRKALVLVQFIVAPVMIGGTYLIFKQTEHLVDRDLGVNKDQVLVVKAPRVDAGNMVDKFDRFKFNVEESSNVNA
ncbi:MAG: ABC transporter permease, partial [Cyclobacteriaceae bacterium]